MADADLGSEIALQCVSTAFRMLSGYGSALQVDPKAFHSTLYARLYDLNVNGGDVSLALSCLEQTLIRQREVSQLRRSFREGMDRVAHRRACLVARVCLG